MKTHFENRSGLSLIDVMIVIATLAFMATFFLFVYPRKKARGYSPQISCVNNLRQVGLAFRLYAGDNNDRYPMNISTNDQPVVNESTQVYEYLQKLQNEMGTPKIVVCPADSKRSWASNFISFSNQNVSYFIGLDANETHPQSVLSGDRNITNGLPPRSGILDLTMNRTASFTDEIHKKQGNIALGDGSVQQVSSARLRSEIIGNSPFATNRIKLP